MFKRLVDNALDGIAVARNSGVIYANLSFSNMTGFGDKTLGSRVSDFFDESEQGRLANEIRPAMVNDGIWQGIARLRRPDGSTWMCQLNAITLHDDQGNVSGNAAFYRDITATLAQAAALSAAEQEQLDLQEQIIAGQQAALRELSTPLIPLADGVLVMPLVGTVDSARAQQVLETLLVGIAEHQAETAILDITGVRDIDTGVANALLRAAQAARLLGARVVLTGIGAEVAQTLVHLDLNMESIVTRSNLQGGIAYALGHE